MIETLREVVPNLWVSDIESAAVVGEDFDIVIDCTGKGPTHGNPKVRTVSRRPSGSGSHAWTVEDLDWITKGTGYHLKAGHKVLIHCRRGVSRSATAAAAVLLKMGLAKNPKDAIRRTSFQGSTPATACVGGLNKWWKELQASRQTKLLLKNRSR